MTDLTRPVLNLYVVWHPGCTEGDTVARAIRCHFRRQHFMDVSGGTGASVIFRNQIKPNAPTPLGIDFEQADITAIVVLSDRRLTEDSDWSSYVHTIIENSIESPVNRRLFPVSLDASGLRIAGDDVNAIRWDSWKERDGLRIRRLLRDLTLAVVRMLKTYLRNRSATLSEGEAMNEYLQNVRVFLSHSKNDSHGKKIARKIRNWLHTDTSMASFFDTVNIPPGTNPWDVISHSIENGVVVAIHTDSFSSRSWCRREILEAKRHHVPMVVANCMEDIDQRGFPYLGNVPIIRMNPSKIDRIDVVIDCLLKEVLKHSFWKCQIALAATVSPEVRFVPRSPELLDLTRPFSNVASSRRFIVYPNPPLADEESRILRQADEGVSYLSLSQWLSGQQK